MSDRIVGEVGTRAASSTLPTDAASGGADLGRALRRVIEAEINVLRWVKAIEMRERGEDLCCMADNARAESAGAREAQASLPDNTVVIGQIRFRRCD